MNYAVAGLRPADKQCFDSATRRKTQTSESSHTETFSLSEYKNRGTRPRFLWFCKAKPISSSHAAGMTVAHTPCALFPPNLAFGKEGGQACRSRPHEILHKSPALPDFYAAARAAAARTPLPCRGEGVSFPVSSEPETYPGGTASPLDFCKRKEQMQSICSLEILF